MKHLVRTVLGLVAAATLVLTGSAVATADEAAAQPAGNCASCV
jgi:hypothetical protein